MNGLPHSWTMTTIGDVSTTSEQIIPPADLEFQYVDIGSVDRETKRVVASQKILGADAPSRARKLIRSGDTLVSMTRPNLNAVALIVEELDGQIASTGFDVLRPRDIDPRWLFYVVRSSAFVDSMTSRVQGALYPAVKSKDVRSFELPLAPLAEQKRIADKLDTVLARVDACRERLERLPGILRRFRQSVLVEALSGRLTGGATYPTVIFGSLLMSIRGGTAAVPQAQETAYPVLRSSSVRQGCIDFSNVRYLTADQSEREDNFIREGDVLFTRLNGSAEYVGNCAVVEDLGGKRYQYPDRLYCARLKKELLPEFCVYLFALPEIRAEIERRAKSSAGHKRISIQDIKEMEVPLPSIVEQAEIVRRVNSMFASAARLEMRVNNASAAADRLTPALLAKAFCGELVPQDPNDEPASELLKRLADEREGKSRVAKSATAKRVARLSPSDMDTSTVE